MTVSTSMTSWTNHPPSDPNSSTPTWPPSMGDSLGVSFAPNRLTVSQTAALYRPLLWVVVGVGWAWQAGDQGVSLVMKGRLMVEERPHLVQYSFKIKSGK